MSAAPVEISQKEVGESERKMDREGRSFLGPRSKGGAVAGLLGAIADLEKGRGRLGGLAIFRLSRMTAPEAVEVDDSGDAFSLRSLDNSSIKSFWDILILSSGIVRMLYNSTNLS